MPKRRSNRETELFEDAIACSHHIETECKGGIYDAETSREALRFMRIQTANLRIRENMIELMNTKEDDRG